MNDKPPLDFLLHNLKSLLLCIHTHYGYIPKFYTVSELKGGEEE